MGNNYFIKTQVKKLKFMHYFLLFIALLFAGCTSETKKTVETINVLQKKEKVKSIGAIAPLLFDVLCDRFTIDRDSTLNSLDSISESRKFFTLLSCMYKPTTYEVDYDDNKIRVDVQSDTAPVSYSMMIASQKAYEAFKTYVQSDDPEGISSPEILLPQINDSNAKYAAGISTSTITYETFAEKVSYEVSNQVVKFGSYHDDAYLITYQNDIKTVVVWGKDRKQFATFTMVHDSFNMSFLDELLYMTDVQNMMDNREKAELLYPNLDLKKILVDFSYLSGVSFKTNGKKTQEYSRIVDEFTLGEIKGATSLMLNNQGSTQLDQMIASSQPRGANDKKRVVIDEKFTYATWYCEEKNNMNTRKLITASQIPKSYFIPPNKIK